ncbi:MAG TPA: hypothetical protein VLB74_07740 [Flavobacterium sp.]|uniref:hypothetical protein n=1 Tax=Flavobacterium sp. TaxID=239 RepID=UPI002C6814C8|nr:hypothetical protein [Flavobacterium sp.]HSD14524.1 hypothetical protein [Flavobacterium sp.]
MKLSEQQLETIDKVLTNQGVTFVDFKIEITDHIACEVEEMCTNKNIDFEVAFETILKKWSSQLTKRGSLWLSQSYPKIIMEDIGKRMSKEKLISGIPMVLFIICFAFFGLRIKWLDGQVDLLKTIYFVLLGVLIIFGVKLNYRSAKTSHRFLFNRSFIYFSMFSFMFLILNVGLGLLFFLSVLLIRFPFIVRNAIRHEHCIKKLSY